MQQHASTYSVLTHTLDPWGGFQRSKHFFSESSHVAYQIRREWSIEHHASTYSVITHPRPLGGVTGQNNFFSESSHVAYQIKGNGA